ncbi:MAG: hypothetical protein K8R58_11580 [Bacteroidales bacterium]|nr:hypothetical protein [Bacteroidales bacterium]
MKKIKVILGLAVSAIIVAVLILNSCGKQELVEQTVTDKQENKMSEQDISFQDNLVQFRDKVNYIRKNPEYKSGEIMDSDEAILHMESLFNATYSFNDEHYTKTKTDKTTIQIGVNENDEVSLDDVVVTFGEIINIVTQFYYQCDFNQKGFLLLDLEKGETTNNQLEISMRSVIGEKDSEWEPFGPDDDWWYGYKKGDCDWINGNGIFDAAVKIQEAIMNNKPLVYPPPGYRFAYSDYELIERFGHEYKDESGAYLIFYFENELGSFTWDDKCLVPDEMNFHYFGEEEVIYNILPVELNKPANWVFMECFLEGLSEENPGAGDIPSIHHNNELTYALRYLVAVGVIDPPIEL